MTDLGPGYVVEGQFDDAILARAKASTFAPGDVVRLAPSGRPVPPPDLRVLANAYNGRLRIEEVVFAEDLHVRYRFSGSATRFEAGYVADLRDMRHVYGVMTQKDGRVFVVEVLGEDDATSAGLTVEITGEPEPYVRWNQGLDTSSDVLRFATEEDGTSGEFVVADNGDGTSALVGIPRSAEVSESDFRVAHEAIAAALAVGTAPAR